jgi:hypothetical protein
MLVYFYSFTLRNSIWYEDKGNEAFGRFNVDGWDLWHDMKVRNGLRWL